MEELCGGLCGAVAGVVSVVVVVGLGLPRPTMRRAAWRGCVRGRKGMG